MEEAKAIRRTVRRVGAVIVIVQVMTIDELSTAYGGGPSLGPIVLLAVLYLLGSAFISFVKFLKATNAGERSDPLQSENEEEAS